MSADEEFKDAGRYFGEGSFATLPLPSVGQDWTIEGWFIWMEGEGPLLQASECDLMYNRAGFSAYRLRDVERITTVSVPDVQNRWIYVVLAKTGSTAVLRIDAGVVDVWDAAPVDTALFEHAVVMRGALGFAADIALYDCRLPDDRLDARWNAGKARV
jgi:hypothetical protein